MWIKKAVSFLNDVRTERLRLWCLELLDPGIFVSISEVNCPEPDCPPVKTVILVMDQGKPTRSYIIHRRIEEIERADVIHALSASAASPVASTSAAGQA